MWSYEMRMLPRLVSDEEWTLSAKRASDIQEAADFAAAWLVICAENNLLCEVRLVQVTSSLRRKQVLGPFVNLNGTSREELIKQAFDVSSAAETLIQALRDAAPHGRDYQTASPEKYKHDRAIWELQLKTIHSLHEDYRLQGERLYSDGQKNKRT